MRVRDDQRAMLRRIKRAEDAADATIQRAFQRVIHTLERELTEYQIRAARRSKAPSPTSLTPKRTRWRPSR